MKVPRVINEQKAIMLERSAVLNEPNSLEIRTGRWKAFGYPG